MTKSQITSIDESILSIQQNKIPQQSNNHKPPTLIFSIMTLTNILINLDHGILPACTTQLQQTFNMNQTQLGFLGSIVYLGIVTMGTFAGQLYQRFNSKLLTIFALALLQGSLILFVLSQHKVYAYICRYLTGVCQVFLLVYYPVWIDKFGQDKKTLWLTLLQICVPVGIFLGYGMTALIQNLDGSFKYSFYIQIGFVAAFLLIFTFMPKSKLDSRRSQSQQLQFTQNFIGELKVPLTQNLMPSQQGLHQSPLSQKQKKRRKKQNNSYFKNMKRLLRSKMYLVGTFTMSCILFVSTGIQFWLTDYFVNVEMFDRALVNIAYGVVSMTGPTSGCGFGGYVINRIGGYQNPKTIYYLLLFSIIGIGSAVVIPFIDNFYVAATLLWLVLFFGGAMMPGLTGIMMVSVPPHLRAFGNSNGQIVKNIFGYLPAPFSYGWFNSMFNSNKAGIKLIMFWGLWVPFLLSLGSLYRYRQLKNKSPKQIKKILNNEVKKIMSTQEIVIGGLSEQLIVEQQKQDKIEQGYKSEDEKEDEYNQKQSQKQKLKSKQQQNQKLKQLQKQKLGKKQKNKVIKQNSNQQVDPNSINSQQRQFLQQQCFPQQDQQQNKKSDEDKSTDQNIHLDRNFKEDE